MQIRIANNIFSPDKIYFDCNRQGVRVKAEVNFKRPIFLNGDIMGFFKFVPFMECRHKVYFITCETDGYIEYNKNRTEFNNAIGYLESDRGVSFPKEYLWTHYGGFDSQGEKFAVMLSVADIPYLKMKFTGCICSIYHKNKEYRLATYKGAKVINLTDKSAKIIQGNYVFIAERLEENALSLKAPLKGSMSRTIKENICVNVRYYFAYKDKIIFDVKEYGGFEYFNEKPAIRTE